MKKLIIFDCDGTLVDSEIIACKVFPAVWSTMGVQMTEEEFLCTIVGTGSDSEVKINLRARLPANAKDITDIKFDEALKQNLKAVTGIPELLQTIRHDLCVASNSSPRYLHNVLGYTQIAHHFGDKVFSAHQVAKSKPAPDLFLHAAATLGFKPQDCLVIEDSPTGIKAAKNANMKVVGLMAGLHFNQILIDRLLAANADLYCSTTDELSKIIDTF